MAQTNPFTERARITNPARFAGRWGELSLIFERLGAGRPVLVAGPAGIGKSSLLTHVVQSAAVNLELPELRAYYLDAAGAASAADVYGAVAGALGHRGDTIAAFELALVGAGDTVLLAIDNLDAPLATGWGEALLEALARVARGGDLFLVAAMAGQPPLLSEPFAILRLGALAQTEVRLLAETYLDTGEAGISFTPSELRELTELSGAHPAYVQRAAFHLYAGKIDPSYDWRAAYRAEVRARPIAGAPLPPAVFDGQPGQQIERSAFGEAAAGPAAAAPAQIPLPDAGPISMLIVPLLLATLLYAVAGSLVLALVAALAGVALAALWRRASSRR